MDLARVMNEELKELVKAGARYIQIDEPYFSGFPEDLGWGVDALNVLGEGVNARIGVHICYGNRYGKPAWEGSYRYLFPRILEAKVQQLTLEFARRGGEDLDLFREFPVPFEVGVGVIDVKTQAVETPEIVAERIRKALEFLPKERLFVLPDCGCFHLPRTVAFAKLSAMVEGTKILRKELCS
jgi:5-methyltetrahydropteroyltriglutamate--homocysteine methyltransferase